MPNLDWLLPLAQSDLFSNVVRYMITLLGALCMYLFSFNKGFNGAAPKLRKLFPGRTEVFYERWDFILVVVLGSVIGSIFFGPRDSVHALAAGFGWVGAVNVLLAKKSRS
jgi:hypothetical protein